MQDTMLASEPYYVSTNTQSANHELFDASFCNSSASSMTMSVMNCSDLSLLTSELPFSNSRSAKSEDELINSPEMLSTRSLFKETPRFTIGSNEDGATWQLREQSKYDSIPTMPRRSRNSQDFDADPISSVTQDDENHGGKKQQLTSKSVFRDTFDHSKVTTNMRKALESQPADAIPFAFQRLCQVVPKMFIRSRDTDEDATAATAATTKQDPSEESPRQLTRESRWTTESASRSVTCESDDGTSATRSKNAAFAGNEPRKKKKESSTVQRRSDSTSRTSSSNDSSKKESSKKESSKKESSKKESSKKESSKKESSKKKSITKTSKSETKPEIVSSVTTTTTTPSKKTSPTAPSLTIKRRLKGAASSPSASDPTTATNASYQGELPHAKSYIPSRYLLPKVPTKPRSETRRRRKFIDDALASILEQDGDIEQEDGTAGGIMESKSCPSRTMGAAIQQYNKNSRNNNNNGNDIWSSVGSRKLNKS
jgi:hypothetical protein